MHEDVLIAVLFDCHDSVIAEELHNMRVAVRKRTGSNNMRTKDSVISMFWEFIHQAEERRRVQRSRRLVDSDEYNPLFSQEKRVTKGKRQSQKTSAQPDGM